LLDNPLFGEHIKNWLKTFRKRNAMVLLLSQELGDITKASISESINAETATKIFFPDSAPLKEVYRDVFQLSEREMHLLKEYSAEKNRFFLIKQPHESTFATLDLSGMEQWIPVLSGNSDTVKLLHQLIQKHGPEQAQWLPAYLRQAASVKSQ
jgi:type IV secretion system protein VirB4